MQRAATAPTAPAAFTPALMRAPEAASYLALSRRHLATLTARGTLPAVRIGRKCTRYRRADLDAFIAGKAA